MVTAAAETVTKSVPAHAPILVDLGKKSRKKVKRLRDGEGSLMTKVNNVIEELRANGTLKTDAQPVLILVTERRRKSRGGLMFR